MKTAILKEAITNTVLDMTITLAPAGAKVTILEEFSDYYEVAYYDGEAPSATFYVSKQQVTVNG